jgi:glycerol-3-phosphate acyltransferase PlsY
MSYAYLALAFLLAYLLGSVPFAVIVSKVFGLADPRSYGSGNPGATNVLRSGNKLAAVLTLLGDGAKGALAILLARHFGAGFGWGENIVALLGLAAFFGHLYPVFLKFRGGTGVATAAGILLAINLWLGLGVLLTWIVVVFIFRYSSLGALVAATAAPLYAGLSAGFDFSVMAISIMSLALVGKHWANLQRLMAGTEPRLGSKKKHA